MKKHPHADAQDGISIQGSDPSFNWTMGDGSPGYQEENVTSVTHTYLARGLYQVGVESFNPVSRSPLYSTQIAVQDIVTGLSLSAPSVAEAHVPHPFQACPLIFKL